MGFLFRYYIFIGFYVCVWEFYKFLDSGIGRGFGVGNVNLYLE